MDARQKLDVFAEMQGWDKNKLIGWSEAADFAEWYAKQVQNLIKPAVSGSTDRYTKKLDKDWDDDIYTIEEWEVAVNDGWICNDDGSGYWVKDGLKSHDEVFSTPKLDATHVVWYNK